MNDKENNNRLGHYGMGIDAPWYEGQDLSDSQREVFRKRSRESAKAKMKAINGEGPTPIHPINAPKLKPENLMPQKKGMALKALSLFSGGGGLDLGFDLAGFKHIASYEILPDACETLKLNRPSWEVLSGDNGDVKKVNWNAYKGKIDVIHGGPPCQPFSIAGRQLGWEDDRNLIPELVRAIHEIQPRAFVMENVPSLGQKRFKPFVDEFIYKPLNKGYDLIPFLLEASSFGIPQKRKRLFIVGTSKKNIKQSYVQPTPTHSAGHFKKSSLNQLSFDVEFELKRCMGVREALGLPDIGYDGLAPTLRSGLTGPRHTTSILSSASALKEWNKLQIWPNGVAPSREDASVFVSKNGHFRLSVTDCGVICGFPESWAFHGAVYMVIGQIGNAVAPPVAYHLARSIVKVLE